MCRAEESDLTDLIDRLTVFEKIPWTSLKHSTATCGTHDGSRPQLVEGASNSRAAAATRTRVVASASARVATSSAQSFASAAVAPSVEIGFPAGQARRDTHCYLFTTATLGQAAR